MDLKYGHQTGKFYPAARVPRRCENALAQADSGMRCNGEALLEVPETETSSLTGKESEDGP